MKLELLRGNRSTREHPRQNHFPSEGNAALSSCAVLGYSGRRWCRICETKIGPKYRLSKDSGLYCDATHTNPGSTPYFPNRHGVRVRPRESVVLGVVLLRSVPLTAMPWAETSTVSP